MAESKPKPKPKSLSVPVLPSLPVMTWFRVEACSYHAGQDSHPTNLLRLKTDCNLLRPKAVCQPPSSVPQMISSPRNQTPRTVVEEIWHK